MEGSASKSSSGRGKAREDARPVGLDQRDRRRDRRVRTNEVGTAADLRAAQATGDELPGHHLPVPAELGDFSLNEFTPVSCTKDSLLFTSTNPHLPGWVRLIATHRERVRRKLCEIDQLLEE